RGAMYLEHVLCQIDADDANFSHGCPLLQLVLRHHEFGTSRCRQQLVKSSDPGSVHGSWLDVTTTRGSVTIRINKPEGVAVSEVSFSHSMRRIYCPEHTAYPESSSSEPVVGVPHAAHARR